MELFYLQAIASGFYVKCYKHNVRNGTTDYKIVNNIGNTDNLRKKVLAITFRALRDLRESRTYIDNYGVRRGTGLTFSKGWNWRTNNNRH